MNKPLATLLFAGLLAAGNAAATRILEQVEKSYELTLGDLILPGSTAGSVIFKPCDDCTTTSLPVDRETRYFVDGNEYALADFLRLAEDLRGTSAGDSRTAATVHYWIENPRVSRLRLDTVAR